MSAARCAEPEGFCDGAGCDLPRPKMMLRLHRASGGARSIGAPSCGSAGKGWAAFGNAAHSVSQGHQDADTQQGVQLRTVQSRTRRGLGEICLPMKAKCLNLRACCCTFQLCLAYELDVAERGTPQLADKQESLERFLGNCIWKKTLEPKPH